MFCHYALNIVYWDALSENHFDVSCVCFVLAFILFHSVRENYVIKLVSYVLVKFNTASHANTVTFKPKIVNR